MSPVGPRPFVVYEADQITGLGRRRLDMTPGITGLWQVLGRNDIPFDEMVKLDYIYVTNWSPWWDFKILCQTIPVVLGRRGAYAEQPRPAFFSSCVERLDPAGERERGGGARARLARGSGRDDRFPRRRSLRRTALESSRLRPSTITRCAITPAACSSESVFSSLHSVTITAASAPRSASSGSAQSSARVSIGFASSRATGSHARTRAPRPGADLRARGSTPRACRSCWA